MHYVFLIIAVVLETIGTTSLYASQQFTKFWPTVLTIAAYLGAFYLLSLTMKTMPVGIVYAMWSGLGVVLISAIGVLWLGQKLDLAAIIGLAMIVGGVMVINLLSNSVTH